MPSRVRNCCLSAGPRCSLHDICTSLFLIPVTCSSLHTLSLCFLLLPLLRSVCCRAVLPRASAPSAVWHGGGSGCCCKFRFDLDEIQFKPCSFYTWNMCCVVRGLYVLVCSLVFLHWGTVPSVCFPLCLGTLLSSRFRAGHTGLLESTATEAIPTSGGTAGSALCHSTAHLKFCLNTCPEAATPLVS